MNWLEFENSSERLLGRCLRRQAEAIPDLDFLIADTEHYSYGRANTLANSCAAGFAKLGVSRGDSVAFLLNSCPEYVFATLGLNKLGAVWIPTSTDYKGTWLLESLQDSRSRVLVADGALLSRLAALGEDLPFEHVVVLGEPEAKLTCATSDFGELLTCGDSEPDDSELYYGDTAAVLWTSGTTGRSKGVMQSHNVWINAAISGALTADARAGDVIYNVLPLYNSGAWVANIYRALVTGLPCATDPGFSASDFWERTRFYGATTVFTLGAMHIFLWQAPERPDDADNPVRVASMIPMPGDLEEPFKKRFGIESISQGYGQSEVMGLMSRTPDRKWKPNCLGAPLPGIEVKLLDDEDREVATGEVGEVCIRPVEPFSIFNGYYNNPEATLAAFRNLWYHSGDLARQDEDDDYFFVDRKADFIRFKGRNISSFAVEAMVGAHEAVAEVAAHGVTSAELEAEAELKIAVVLREGASLTAEELARFVNENAPYFFVPRYIEFVDKLPYTPSGRIQKYKLRERGVTPQTWDATAAGFKVVR
ncbi:MAG: AMP-binding protein [bacterium]|nr:AMP-binding protein [bacterium]